MAAEPGLQPAGVRLQTVTRLHAHSAAQPAPAQAQAQAQAQAEPDWLAEEVPVALVFNGLSQAVMMATADDLYGVDVVPVQLAGGPAIALRLEVSARTMAALKDRRRTLAGRTGCGLCGTDSLAQVHRALPRVPPTAVQAGALAQAQRGLRRWQAVQLLTGASHAAAWCGPDGAVRLVREDVGR
ncbi:MAG: hypothetical protein CFE45_13645, partial [Burkholderiales bacterium PBB5]